VEPDYRQIIRRQEQTIRQQAEVIRQQAETIRRQQARIAELEQVVARLTARVEELTAQVARLSKNSSNSSKPPSSDIVKPPRPPGHAGNGRIGEFFRDVLALPISDGHLAACCTGKLSEALKTAYEEAASALRHEAVLGSDETGHRHGGKGYWTWCLRAARFSVFRIDATRASKVLADLLGEDFGGILTVDYYSANRSFAQRGEVRTQYCWSHLLRDIKFLRQLGRPPLVRWADQLLAIARGLFRAWHRRTGTDPPRWHRRMER